MDENSRYTYSSIVSVSIQKKPVIMVWPNPTVSALIVNLKSFEGGTGEIKLFDVHGRKVLQKRIRLDAGNTTVALNSLEKFHRGVYHLQVRVGEMSYSNKIVLT